MTITPVAKDIPRDRFGRPQVRPLGGTGGVEAYTRCTTYVGCLEDMFKVHQWDNRMVALGLADRPDLMLAVAALERSDKNDAANKDKLNTLCGQAKEAAKASAKATIGSSVHTLTEQIDRGQEIGIIPEAYHADLAAYQHETAHLISLHIERFTVLDDLKIGGTPDRIVDDNGTLKIADVKTGSIQWGMGKIAMQLAVYAHSQFYDPDTAERTPIGPVDQNEAIVIHLPAGEGRCELVTVDIAAGWEAVQLATAVRAWRARKDLARPYATAALPTADGDADQAAEPAGPVNDALANQIASAATVDELGTLWANHYHDFTDGHIELASARKRLLLSESVA